jgi:hypothetical protein
MVIHRSRVSDRITEDRAVRSHDRHPRVDSLGQPLDERIDGVETFVGFQRRRHCRCHDLCLGLELLGQTIDVELATGDGEVEPEHHQYGNYESDLGQRKAAAEGVGQERCEDRAASWRCAGIASGRRCD